MTHKAYILGCNTQGLKYAENDANNIESVLAQQGYQITRLKKDIATIQTDMRTMREGTTLHDTVIIYFAGHAFFDEELYFVHQESALTKNTALPAQELTSHLKNCKARHKLLILDCCQASGANENFTIKLDNSYAVLTASGKHQRSHELESIQAGVLTWHICQALQQPQLDLLNENHQLTVNKLYNDWLCPKINQFRREKNIADLPTPKLVGDGYFPIINYKPKTIQAPSAAENLDKQQFIEVLHQKLIERKLVLCLGPSFSYCAGMPGWRQIFSALGCRGDELIIAESDYAAFIDDFVTINRFSIDDIKNHIQRALDDVEPTKNQLYTMLQKLPVATILSANYDQNLEDLYPRIKRRVISNADQLDQLEINSSKTQIVYLLGNTGTPSNMLVSNTELANYKQSHEWLLNKLAPLLVKQSLLFLGFAATDPVFKALVSFLPISTADSTSEQSHYALFNQASANELAICRLRHGLCGLVLDKEGSLEQFIQLLITPPKSEEKKQEQENPKVPADVEMIHQQIADSILSYKLNDKLTDFNEWPFKSPTYLPRQVPHFTGREADLQAVLIALQNHGPVSITGLMGMGGIGKTSLATAVAHHCKDHGLFKDGICWHVLADQSLEQSLGKIATELGMSWLTKINGLAERTTVFRQALQGRQLLFVLDDANYPDRLPEILDLLNQHPVLITSRSNLSVLSMSITVERLTLNDAKRLFIKTWQANLFNNQQTDAALLALTSQEQQLLQHICEQHLGGLPLAISIAASLCRFKHWQLKRLAKELEQQHLLLLEDKQRVTATAAKDRNVRLSLSLSYDLLPKESEDDKQRLVFDVTGVFSTEPFTLDALAAACELTLEHTENAVNQLVALHLVQYTDELRLILHPLNREYAIERLAQRDEMAPWQRMVGHYVTLVKENPKALTYDWRNALHAVEWCFNYQNYADGFFLMGKIDHHWYVEGMWSLRGHWLTLAVKAAEAAEQPTLVFKFKDQLGDLWTRQGHDQKALMAYQQLRDYCVNFPELTKNVTWCDYVLASLLEKSNQRKKSLMLNQTNLRRTIQLKHWWNIGGSCRSMGYFFLNRASLSRALECFEVGREIHIGRKFSGNIPRTHMDIFACYLQQGLFFAANEVLQDIRMNLNNEPNMELEGGFQQCSFLLALGQKNLAAAQQFLTTYKGIAKKLGQLEDIVRAEYYQGLLEHRQQKNQVALACFESAIQQYSKYGFDRQKAPCCRYLARIHIGQSDFRQARIYLEQSAALHSYCDLLEKIRWQSVYALLQAHSGYSYDAVRAIERVFNSFGVLGIGDIAEEQQIKIDIEQLLGDDYHRALQQLHEQGLVGETLELADEVNHLDPTIKQIISPVDQREMVLIPSGLVKAPHYDHGFFLYPFYVDKYPVSNQQYQYYLDSMNLSAPAHWPQGRLPKGQENHPVTGINFDEAQAYAQWCGKTLPLAEEWEVAAGIREGREYPWGLDQDSGVFAYELENEKAESVAHIQYIHKHPIFALLKELIQFPDEIVVEQDRFLMLALASLSLNTLEKQNVFDAIPNLIQHQIDDLIKVWEDEAVKFKDLIEDHPQDIVKLQIRCIKQLPELYEIYLYKKQVKSGDVLTTNLPKTNSEQAVFVPLQIKEWVDDLIINKQNVISEKSQTCKGSGAAGIGIYSNKINARTTRNAYQHSIDIGFRCVKPIFAPTQLDDFLQIKAVDHLESTHVAWLMSRIEFLFNPTSKDYGFNHNLQAIKYCQKVFTLVPFHARAVEVVIRLQYKKEKSIKYLNSVLKDMQLLPCVELNVQQAWDNLLINNKSSDELDLELLWDEMNFSNIMESEINPFESSTDDSLNLDDLCAETDIVEMTDDAQINYFEVLQHSDTLKNNDKLVDIEPGEIDTAEDMTPAPLPLSAVDIVLNALENAIGETVSHPSLVTETRLHLSTRNTRVSQDYLLKLHGDQMPKQYYGLIVAAFLIKRESFS